MLSEYLSTGDVARICRVSGATVRKWIDAGLLAGHCRRGRYRQVRREDLVEFVKRHGMPEEWLDGR
jgi:excisionase family DNA binding protein